MNRYILNLESHQKNTEDRIREAAKELNAQINNRADKVSEAVSSMGNIDCANDILNQERQNNEWIKEILKDSDLLKEAANELGENLYDLTASTLEYLNTSETDILNRQFAKTDAVQSGFQSAVLGASLAAVYIAKKRRKND